MLGILGAIAVGALIVKNGIPFVRTQPPSQVQTAPVTQGTLQVSVSATGPVTNPTSVPVSFKTTGLISEIDVVVGQRVSSGQVLARIDPGDLQDELNQAQATYNQQVANLAKLEAGPW